MIIRYRRFLWKFPSQARVYLDLISDYDLYKQHSSFIDFEKSFNFGSEFVKWLDDSWVEIDTEIN